MMNDFGKNIEINTMNSLLVSRVDELSRKAETGKNTNLSDDEKSKFAKVSRGFEAMFVNMLIKEMKSSMLDEEDSEFSGPMQEYTDLLFSEHIAGQDSGIGIADKVYKFLTGEELPVTKIIEPRNTIQTVLPETISKNVNRQIKPIIDEVPNIIETKGNFVEKVKNRIGTYDSIISAASKRFGVPEELIKAVITAESAGHNNAKSKAGAKGLMQLMDGTARELGVSDSFDAEQNIYGGTLYLRKMLDKFGNNRDFALAAYNAGPGNVEKYNGVPPFRETENYIKKINKYLNQFLTEEKSKEGILL